MRWLTLAATLAALEATADPRITEIRRGYRTTRAQLASYTQAEFDVDGHSTDGGRAIAYLTSEGELRAVIGWLFGEGGKVRFEHYFAGGSLIFVFDEWHEYNVPYYWTAEAVEEAMRDGSHGHQVFDPTKTRVFEARCYFANGAAIRSIPFSSASHRYAGSDPCNLEFPREMKRLADRARPLAEFAGLRTVAEAIAARAPNLRRVDLTPGEAEAAWANADDSGVVHSIVETTRLGSDEQQRIECVYQGGVLIAVFASDLPGGTYLFKGEKSLPDSGAETPALRARCASLYARAIAALKPPTPSSLPSPRAGPPAPR